MLGSSCTGARRTQLKGVQKVQKSICEVSTGVLAPITVNRMENLLSMPLKC